MKILDGNKASADIAYLFSEICPVYPITPASPMASEVDALINKDEVNILGNKVKLVSMQSEAGAVATMHGALLSGSLSNTFTASQGLLLMIPNMYKIAGEMLPGVIHVASRAVATHALSIFGEHTDVYAARNTGFCMLCSPSVEDAGALALVSHLASIKGSLPFVHFFDGFRTSHEINTVKEIDKKEIAKLLPLTELENFRNRSLFGKNKIQKGMAENEDIFFQLSEARNNAYLEMPNIVNDYMASVNKLTGSDYKAFTYYGHPYAKNIIIAMGSVTDTIKLVVDDMNNHGAQVGLVTVYLYRPFSAEYLMKALPATTARIAVLDRSKDATMSGEPLYLDVVNALKNKPYDIVGGRYGLASKNTTPAMIKAVFDMLDTNLKNNFTIGIKDDVTNLSLEYDPDYNVKVNADEITIYGFGSDGMVSASKNILKVFGEEENYFVQGYFEYDSKKSNGVTISHLRYGKQKIRAPFYTTNPKLIVITKDEYLLRFNNMLDNIEDYGTVIINTDNTEDQILAMISDTGIEEMIRKNVKLYIIDASKIANESGIKGKISKIMESIILEKLNVPNAKTLVENSIKTIFKTKGEEIINANLKAINSINDNLKFVDVTKSIKKGKRVSPKNLINLINNREGNNLKVSEVYQLRDGSFPCGTSKYEKRNSSNLVPKWDKEKCIECNQCSLVCPHATIRPFVLEESSEYINETIPMMGDEKKGFMISISEADCTGCGLCINACPGKKGEKALSFGKYDAKCQEVANKLFTTHVNPLPNDIFNIKNSQFAKPLFEFSGACAGCGETPYIKLLTQLFGEKIVIANATGCSSIYGGSMPSTPYLIPWANSLFEDNAEFGLGMLLAYQAKHNEAKEVIKSSINTFDEKTKGLVNEWLETNSDDKSKALKEELSKPNMPSNVKAITDYIMNRSIWIIGGDGWAYDIGFGGIDHVLSSNENVNILILDTEVYSNTGGQASKSSRMGQVCEFANNGKRTYKKDMFRKAMTYPNVYVASVSLGANPMQTIKAMKEAESHNGPSIIIAYAPCVEQGLKCGMGHATDEQKLAVASGYTSLMRYKDEELFIDSAAPDFTKYEEFLNNEVRYNALKIKNPSLYEELTKLQIEEAKKRYAYYESIKSNK